MIAALPHAVRTVYAFVVFALTADPLAVAAADLALIVSLTAVVVLAYVLTPLPPHTDTSRRPRIPRPRGTRR